MIYGYIKVPWRRRSWNRAHCIPFLLFSLFYSRWSWQGSFPLPPPQLASRWFRPCWSRSASRETPLVLLRLVFVWGVRLFCRCWRVVLLWIIWIIRWLVGLLLDSTLFYSYIHQLDMWKVIYQNGQRNSSRKFNPKNKIFVRKMTVLNVLKYFSLYISNEGVCLRSSFFDLEDSTCGVCHFFCS